MVKTETKSPIEAEWIPTQHVRHHVQLGRYEAEIDEYTHAMFLEDRCHEVDSYLVRVFEFIIAQYLLKAALNNASGNNKEAIQKMIHKHLMTQYSLKTGLKKFGREGELQEQRNWVNFLTQVCSYPWILPNCQKWRELGHSPHISSSRKRTMELRRQSHVQMEENNGRKWQKRKPSPQPYQSNQFS